MINYLANEISEPKIVAKYSLGAPDQICLLLESNEILERSSLAFMVLTEFSAFVLSIEDAG